MIEPAQEWSTFNKNHENQRRIHQSFERMESTGRLRSNRSFIYVTITTAVTKGVGYWAADSTDVSGAAASQRSGFKSQTSLNCFRLSFLNCVSCILKCNDLLSTFVSWSHSLKISTKFINSISSFQKWAVSVLWFLWYIMNRIIFTE